LKKVNGVLIGYAHIPRMTRIGISSSTPSSKLAANAFSTPPSPAQRLTGQV
jgi:hypothetical protein